jgi:hypothetical protein
LRWPAEAVQEEIMRLQLGEGARALARAVAEDARDRQPSVVIQDRLRHAAEKGKGGMCPSRNASIRSTVHVR